MMHPYKCQVCGETYLGETPPDRCPFCGAAGSELKKASLWYNRGKVAMSPQSYDNCKKALDLELNNAAFYKCAAGKAANRISQSIFKRLFKQELEHAKLLAKAMGIEVPALPPGECKGSDGENFVEAHQHEDMAIEFYMQAAADAEKGGEPEVAYIFRNLTEIETEHLMLTNLYK
ncbi:rubredoxin-like domain-containing protein [Thermincola potens]|uniref:Rubrerythrin n=1 Tax=Thermincola potens (strain JR) TaxID=635013 RepID=D5XAC6_THEPJ|nr:rubrerythrin [Thermincola potens]ADG81225.1 Rubrerythrin [Thermincola potens JR]